MLVGRIYSTFIEYHIISPTSSNISKDFEVFNIILDKISSHKTELIILNKFLVIIL